MVLEIINRETMSKMPTAGGDIPCQDKAIRNVNSCPHIGHALDTLYRLHRRGHLFDIRNVDAIAVPQRRSRHLIQQGVIRPPLFILLEGLLPGDKDGLLNVGDRLDLRLKGLSLFRCVVLVYVGQKFIFCLEAAQQLV